MKLNPDAQCVFQSTQQVRIECHFEHIPGPWSKPQGTADEKVEDEEVDEFLTDYDFRHRHRLIPPLATLPHGSYCFVSIRLILQRAEAAVVTGATVGFGFPGSLLRRQGWPAASEAPGQAMGPLQPIAASKL